MSSRSGSRIKTKTVQVRATEEETDHLNVGADARFIQAAGNRWPTRMLREQRPNAGLSSFDMG